MRRTIGCMNKVSCPRLLIQHCASYSALCVFCWWILLQKTEWLPTLANLFVKPLHTHTQSGVQVCSPTEAMTHTPHGQVAFCVDIAKPFPGGFKVPHWRPQLTAFVSQYDKGSTLSSLFKEGTCGNGNMGGKFHTITLQHPSVYTNHCWVCFSAHIWFSFALQMKRSHIVPSPVHKQ